MGRKRQQRDSDDDDYYGPHDGIEYPDMSQKAQRQEVDVAETPVPPRPAQTSPHVRNALNGPLGDAGIAGAGPLEPLAVSLMPTRIATAVLARRCEEKFESSDATECKKAMGRCLAVRPDGEWKLHDAVLDKEMRAFDNMRDRFRHAARYGRLSARDRNSELGQYFLHARPHKQQEVRKEYKGTLRDMWSAWAAAQPVGGAQPVQECVVM